MKAIEAKIRDLENLVHRMISDHIVLQKENEQLKAERSSLEANLQSRSEDFQKLELQLERMRLARGLAGDPEEAKAAKAKLGSLMREIDRCIAMLNE
ncbi:MAG: hypothetical protein ACPGVV_09870 [Croceimicrobium sp.]|nr:hypothetical protein [Bacteroidota bacterium]